jgi:hypothetical protein
MKYWECVQVEHHVDIGSKIEEYERNGWTLHTYQASATSGAALKANINHYLLFWKNATLRQTQ